MKHGLHSVIHPDGFALHGEADVFNFLRLSHPLQGGKWNHAGADLLLSPTPPPSSVTCLKKEKHKLVLKTEISPEEKLQFTLSLCRRKTHYM